MPIGKKGLLKSKKKGKKRNMQLEDKNEKLRKSLYFADGYMQVGGGGSVHRAKKGG